MNRLEQIEGGGWREFLSAPVAVLVLGKSDCAACQTWGEELDRFLAGGHEWSHVRFGKMLLDQPGLSEFKRANPWLAEEVDTLPYTQIYVGGARWKAFTGGGIDRLVDRLRYDAYHDRLTALPNRRRVTDALAESVKVRAPGEVVAVISFDVDGLRDVNESMGHAAGDKLLDEVAKRLRGIAGPGALVGRIGGDEFVVTLRAESTGSTVQLVGLHPSVIAPKSQRSLPATMPSPHFVASQASPGNGQL